MGEVVDIERAVNGGEREGTQNEEGLPPAILVDGSFVAPSLRVEELRDDASFEALSGYSSSSACSSVYGTDDEYALSGEASDQDGSARPADGSKTDPDFEIPSDELKKKIVDQVEFFFSNENIIHDAFMLKHVRRNKMGYVSLKLVTSFRKVKSLTKDYHVVAYCLKSSEKLEVNEEGTKIRRREPLPDFDETTPSRTIVATNLPFQNPNVEDVAEKFSSFGEIALVRILRPGKQVPPDVKKHIVKHPELGSTICAVIEYEKHESAKAACEQMNDGNDDMKKGMNIILLAAPKKERRNKEEKKCGKEEKEKKDSTQNFGGKRRLDLNDNALNNNNSIKEDQKKVFHKDNLGGFVASNRSSLNPLPDPNKLSPGGSPRTTPRSSPRSSPRASPTAVRKRSSHGPSPLAAELVTTANLENRLRSNNESPSQSPWVQRRLKAQEENSLGANSPGASPRMTRRAVDGETNGLKSLDAFGILRQPKGPDGTKGFQLSRTNLTKV